MGTSNLVSGGRVATPRGVTRTVPATATNLGLAKRRAPFIRRYRLLVGVTGIVIALTAFIVLMVVGNRLGSNINRVDVLLNTPTTYRAHSLYVGQADEITRTWVALLIFLAALICIGLALWLIIPPMRHNSDMFWLVFFPIFGGIALLALATVNAVAFAPGTTDDQAVYNAASNWLELDHNIPYDISNYMYNLRGDDAYTNFAHNVNLINEFGQKQVLTISVGGADQSILTLHVKAKNS